MNGFECISVFLKNMGWTASENRGIFFIYIFSSFCCTLTPNDCDKLILPIKIHFIAFIVFVDAHF